MRGGYALPLTIDLADREDSGVFANFSSSLLVPQEDKIIKIEWRDFGIPSAPADEMEFWEELLQLIKSLGVPTIVKCMGGHGRTGTALAVLLKLAGFRGDCIKEVRKRYCEEAVETKSQIRWLRSLGIHTNEHPAKTLPITSIHKGAEYESTSPDAG